MINAGIYEGDIVIVQPDAPKEGDVVAALIDGQTTLKRFVHNKADDQPYLKAENPSFPDLHPASELVIQGIARAVLRRL